MTKIALEVSYDGTNYAGFQRQVNRPTIQGELENALTKMTNEFTPIIGSGRTDAGVHALGQIIHFTTQLQVPIEKWSFALKGHLPNDIIIRRAFMVAEDFHARYDAIEKIYQYRLDRGKIPNVFYRNYAYHYPFYLNLEEIYNAKQYLIGTHDYSAFTSNGTAVINRVRTIHAIHIIEENEFLTFTFSGNGFLYNMVRILVGTLLYVGSGKLKADELPAILESRDRRRAGMTTPPHGLTLMRVNYPEDKLIKQKETT